MAVPRTAIPDFQVANSAYIGATVYFYLPNDDGTPSATLATLYADLTGVATLPNPQTLDSTGKFQQPVYINQDVVGSVVVGAVNHDTGVISYLGGWRGDYVAAGTRYFRDDMIVAPAGSTYLGNDIGGNIYISQSIWSSTLLASDLADPNKLTLFFDTVAARDQVVADATEDTPGKVKLATLIDFLTSDNTKAITPYTLQLLMAAYMTSIAVTRAGTASQVAVTPDSLASLWQQGSDITAAATLVKPADDNLGGYHVVNGNTDIVNFWTGEKDGTEIELRFTGIPIIQASGNVIPPGGAAFQVTAGDTIRFRWESGGTVVRAMSSPGSGGGADPLFRYLYLGS